MLVFSSSHFCKHWFQGFRFSSFRTRMVGFHFADGSISNIRFSGFRIYDLQFQIFDVRIIEFPNVQFLEIRCSIFGCLKLWFPCFYSEVVSFSFYEFESPNDDFAILQVSSYTFRFSFLFEVPIPETFFQLWSPLFPIYEFRLSISVLPIFQT